MESEVWTYTTSIKFSGKETTVELEIQFLGQISWCRDLSHVAPAQMFTVFASRTLCLFSHIWLDLDSGWQWISSTFCILESTYIEKAIFKSTYVPPPSLFSIIFISFLIIYYYEISIQEKSSSKFQWTKHKFTNSCIKNLYWETI